MMSILIDLCDMALSDYALVCLPLTVASFVQ